MGVRDTGITAGAQYVARGCLLAVSLRDASDVESQESCIHPMLSHTAGARLVLPGSPLLVRQAQDYRTENCHKYCYKQGRFHISLLRTVYT